MPRGRFVASSLGRSDKFNALPSDRARLLYILALTHADAEGRIEANPALLRADCFPQREDVTAQEVRSDLAAIEQAGLIRCYEAHGKPYAEFIAFHEHNKIYRDKAGNPTREAPSVLPSPTEGAPTAQSLRSAITAPANESSVTPAKDQVEVEVEVEVEDQATTSPTEDSSGGAPPDQPANLMPEGLRLVEDPGEALRALGRKDRRAKEMLDRIAASVHWKFPQKAEVAHDLLTNPAAAKHALEQTYLSSETLTKPFRFYCSVRDAYDPSDVSPRARSVEGDAGRSEFDKAFAAIEEASHGG